MTKLHDDGPHKGMMETDCEVVTSCFFGCEVFSMVTIDVAEGQPATEHGYPFVLCDIKHFNKYLTRGAGDGGDWFAYPVFIPAEAIVAAIESGDIVVLAAITAALSSSHGALDMLKGGCKLSGWLAKHFEGAK